MGRPCSRRWRTALRPGVAPAVVLAVGFGAAVAAPAVEPAQAAPGPPASSAPAGAPVAPSFVAGRMAAVTDHHSYRHGAVPMLPSSAATTTADIATTADIVTTADIATTADVVTERTASTASSSGSLDPLLSYGGGGGGVGVVTGHPEVYLVFWGSQWGTETTTSGLETFSGDPSGMAPILQRFFAGLGTDGDAWSGVMTQYCQGVPAGSTRCPAANVAHVGYPTGGALAGVWEDTSAAAPTEATAHQLAQEAVDASVHFGITTAAANRDVQYVVVSPHDTYPDGFDKLPPNEDFCAWHDDTGDAGLDGGGAIGSSPPVAFTNLPYVTDAGEGCGANFVNAGSAGDDDGVTYIVGHEYAETLTDQFPPDGWTDDTGDEAADKCIWISPGQPGGPGNLKLATGSFPVQAIWGNDLGGGAGGCELHHPVVADETADVIALPTPAPQFGSVGTPVHLRLSARDSSSSATLTYAATGLPSGLALDPATGVVSGTPLSVALHAVTVTARDSNGSTATATFDWSVGTRLCPGGQVLRNGGFETGSNAPWIGDSQAVVSNSDAAGQERSHSGRYFAWLAGPSALGTQNLRQSVSVPAGCGEAALRVWYHVDSTVTGRIAVDRLQLRLLGAGGTTLATLHTYSNRDAKAGYQLAKANLGSYLGRLTGIEITATSPNPIAGYTDFTLDDVAIDVG